jgi:hypothetical protein
MREAELAAVFPRRVGIKKNNRTPHETKAHARCVVTKKRVKGGGLFGCAN